MSIRTKRQKEPMEKEMAKCGWFFIPGAEANHFFDETWTLCQHIGAYHGYKYAAKGHVPDCVTCLKHEEEWKRRNMINLLRDEPDTHHYPGH